MVSVVPAVAAREGVLATPLLHVVEPRAGVVIAIGEGERALPMALALLEAALVDVAVGVAQRACNHAEHGAVTMCVQVTMYEARRGAPWPCITSCTAVPLPSTLVVPPVYVAPAGSGTYAPNTSNVPSARVSAAAAEPTPMAWGEPACAVAPVTSATSAAGPVAGAVAEAVPLDASSLTPANRSCPTTVSWGVPPYAGVGGPASLGLPPYAGVGGPAGSLLPPPSCSRL
eukprot:scaffold8193_cov39-Phaeocystis_antarctica.AAC.1